MSSQFLQSVREYMLTCRYSKRTISSYCYWIKTYIIFNGKKRPEELGENEVSKFLTFLMLGDTLACICPIRWPRNIRARTCV